jgi:hypothetical protein
VPPAHRGAAPHPLQQQRGGAGAPEAPRRQPAAGGGLECGGGGGAASVLRPPPGLEQRRRSLGPQEPEPLAEEAGVGGDGGEGSRLALSLRPLSFSPRRQPPPELAAAAVAAVRRLWARKNAVGRQAGAS